MYFCFNASLLSVNPLGSIANRMITDSKEAEPLKYELQVICCDPGLLNSAICRLSYWGEKIYKDSTGQYVTVPQFSLKNMELFDLKRSVSYAQHPDRPGVIRDKYDQKNNNQPISDLIHMADRLSLMLASKAWLYESYRSLLFENGEKDVLPSVTSEVQCGFIKNYELDCTVLSHIQPWVIKSIDRSRGLEDREIRLKAKKYGITRGKGDEYDDRKEDSEAIVRQLFAECSMKKEIIFLNALLAARKRDIPGGTSSQIKVNDICDAILLGLEDCRKRHAELMKNLGIEPSKEVIEEVITLRPSFFDREDDSDEDALFPKKVRKKRTPAIKKPVKEKSLSLAQRAAAVNESFEQQAKKRKRTPSIPKENKEPVKKRTKKQAVPDELSDSGDEVEIIVTKKTAAVKKYKQLDLC